METTKTTPTPGPWKVVMPYHAHARETCRCVQIGREEAYTTSEVLIKDAELIACAPDLLAAAEKAAAQIRAYVDVLKQSRIPYPIQLADAVTRLDTAIAKATGGTA